MMIKLCRGLETQADPLNLILRDPNFFHLLYWTCHTHTILFVNKGNVHFLKKIINYTYFQETIFYFD